MNIKLFITLFIAFVCIRLTSLGQNIEFDLVINNGGVMDPETMYDDIAPNPDFHIDDNGAGVKIDLRTQLNK